VNDREIDNMLSRAAQAPPAVSSALLDRVAASVGSSLRPVRPLPPGWVLVAAQVVACAGIALLGAVAFKLTGVQRLGAWERALIFPSLALLMGLAAAVFLGEMVPGSRRRIGPRTLLACGILALLALFAYLFRDYRTGHFIARGLTCLSVGMLHAIAAGLAAWLLLRRGFAVNPAAAGLAAGTLAGLCGVTMLELHCANFQALHIMVWHTAVVLLSGLAGALAARSAHRRRSRDS